MSPHLLRVVVVVVAVGVGCGVVVAVVVGRTVVVVAVTPVLVVVPVVVVVLVVVLDDAVVVVVVEDPVFDDDDVVPITVTVRLGCSLPLTTTISPPVAGGRPCRGFVMAACDTIRAANAAPIKAPKETRPEPPSAVSIHNDYRPHSFGSNCPKHLVPA
ncbi:hypothetical protein ACRAKI_00345 [Saccharothrix isguenensis]